MAKGPAEGAGGGGTPLYKPYRVWATLKGLVWFLRHFGLAHLHQEFWGVPIWERKASSSWPFNTHRASFLFKNNEQYVPLLSNQSLSKQRSIS